MAGEGEVGDEEERGRKRGSAGVLKVGVGWSLRFECRSKRMGESRAHQEAAVASRWLAADGGEARRDARGDDEGYEEGGCAPS